MKFVFANNVSTTLAAPISNSATTITLTSATNLPTIPAGQVFAVTLNDAATQSIFEIVYVTAITGANLTVIRGQEGTAAVAWNSGDFAFANDTAGTLENFAQIDNRRAGKVTSVPTDGTLQTVTFSSPMSAAPNFISLTVQAAGAAGTYGLFAQVDGSTPPSSTGFGFAVNGGSGNCIVYWEADIL